MCHRWQRPNWCKLRAGENAVSKRVVAIVGSYRKGATVDTAVEAILAGAREKGAVTQTIHLLDQHLEFCTNCRSCTQLPGEERGICVQEDDLVSILHSVDASDALVLAAPVNFFNVTALFRRFMERLVVHAYWPWNQKGPTTRAPQPVRKAVLVTAAGMPTPFIPLATGAPRALKITAKVLRARPVAKLWIGLAASTQSPHLSQKTLERARQMGRNLV